MTIQYVDRPDLVDLGWGHPAPALLPVDEWRAAAGKALDVEALTYGFGTGPASLKDFIAGRLDVTDALSPVHEQICVTAGASAGLELVTGLLAPPGATVLVDSPTYHLALRILADRDVTVRPLDLSRPLPAAALLYAVPTFANPTGRSMSMERRVALVDACAGKDITIVEDDTYREMSYVDSVPPSLWSLNPRGVVRVGSFAKSVAPGLRLGYLTAWPEFVARIADRGHVDSGGGLNHATAMTMAEFGRSGAFEAHLRRILPVYRQQRDVLVDAIARHVPAAELAVPDGGWFLWLRLPVDGDALLPVAERHGVSFVPGARFCVPPASGASFIRLSFSMLEPSLLEQGARRLGAAVHSLVFG